MNAESWRRSRLTHRWFSDGEFIQPTQLTAIDEILARLRSAHRGELEVFLSPPVRREQSLQPYVLPEEDEQLVRELLALPDEREVIAEALGDRTKQARKLLRHVITEWDKPAHYPGSAVPYLARQAEGVLWLLEQVEIGLTAVRVRVSISGSLPSETPLHIFLPRLLPEGVEQEVLESWWQGFHERVHLSDDLGSHYRLEASESKGGPDRVQVDGAWEVRLAERYTLIFVPGVPLTAQTLSLHGSIDLGIEQPLTESRSWPVKELSLGEYSYTFDLQGWWPGVFRDREQLM